MMISNVTDLTGCWYTALLASMPSRITADRILHTKKAATCDVMIAVAVADTRLTALLSSKGRPARSQCQHFAYQKGVRVTQIIADRATLEII